MSSLCETVCKKNYKIRHRVIVEKGIRNLFRAHEWPVLKIKKK